VPRNLTVILGDKPGELARLGTVMGEASVNIKGLAAFTGDGRGVIHLLVDDADAERALAALKAAKIGVADDRDVLVVDIIDRPGTLGELALELAEANVNIDLAYATFGDTQLVIATDDMDSAMAALGES
jgi:hypothetical protein